MEICPIVRKSYDLSSGGKRLGVGICYKPLGKKVKSWTRDQKVQHTFLSSLLKEIEGIN